MEVFDKPDMMFSCARRERSTHAPQALELLNGKTSNDLAEALAQRLMKEKATPQERINHAFRLTAGRLPTIKEKTRALSFLTSHADDPRAMKEVALALLNLNAFLYVN